MVKKHDLIKYGIFILGIIIILLFGPSQIGNANYNSLDWYQQANLRQNTGQSLILMLFGWTGIYFGSIGIYGSFKKRANKKR